MRSDQITVVDIAVIQIPTRLHLGLNGLHNFTFTQDLVVDLDTGDFLERLGQNLGFIRVGGDAFGQDVNLHARIGLCSFDEPLHLGHLFVFRQGRWLEFVVNPTLCCGFVGPSRTVPRNDGSRRHCGK